MAENIAREFGWDDTIENDSEFQLLPEGDYNFEVINMERARHMGSGKIPQCWKAVLKLKLWDEEGNNSTITHNLFLHSNVEGLLCAFFTAIGHRKHGERMAMDWNKVVGSRGRCKVYIDKWTSKKGNEMESNKIQKFYEPEDSGATSAASPHGATFTPGSF